MNTVTIPILPRFVRYQGKCWYNPSHPLDASGRVDLWSLSEDGAGVGAEPEQVHPCTDAEANAICEAIDAGQLRRVCHT